MKHSACLQVIIIKASFYRIIKSKVIERQPGKKKTEAWYAETRKFKSLRSGNEKYPTEIRYANQQLNSTRTFKKEDTGLRAY
ncbi:hypothetical protein CDAR_382341 [Caerostris darwini]|uniref:Ribosomal protein L33 n=1 Tax=Caerostris darwini TaxID=1538125 RepID=A0AAV4VXM2_9ARAC|nr:hypothetical protein CDAR_382341 [Caerostris darwini]